ncbi:hemoglobin subunit beta isoform X2 [Salmo salar]|uniref:Hemoglobin subunit beta isoform X2 n=1 Tax=Salmo salar TaxID=8030 RepID=A0ABM3EGJ2_SALSA|nr:hemoglobin subunit beta isoform X2 [Salmo salar]
MVDWTDAERSAIVGLWGKISVDEIGPQALARLLIVSPWTQRHFSTFGNLSTPAAIMGNPAVAKHGKTVMHGLDRAVQNLDDIKNAYTALSVMHSEKLHVDPDNFRVPLWSPLTAPRRLHHRVRGSQARSHRFQC